MKNRYIGKVFSIITGLIIIITTVFPFYWVIVSSFKPSKELFSFPPSMIPKAVTLANYIDVLQKTKLPVYFMNSMIYSGATLFIAITIGSLAAYSFSRFKYKGKTIFFIIIILSQVMPITTLIIPLYVLWGKTGFNNSYFCLILTYSAIISPVTTWLLTGYFNSIPREIDESAIIDGCSTVGVLFRIILPLARPGIAAAGLSAVISVWQELMLALTFTNRDSMRTLMAGVTSFITYSGIEWGPLNAAGVLTSVPVLVIYLIFQKSFVRGLTDGAVKG